jgi:PPE-repeat protein
VAIGETISSELWSGPGASSFYAASAALTNVVAQISGILDGQQANAGALLAAWASPTGERAVSANTPYGAWLSQTATQIGTAATQIQATGAAFDSAKAMTPTPAQFAANNLQYAVLVATNILGQNTPLIIANRLEYMMYTALAVTAMANYTAESAVAAGALAAAQALPPPPSAVPGAGAVAAGGAAAAAGLVNRAPMGQAMAAAAPLSSAAAAPLSSVGSSVGSALQPLSSTSSLVSQPTNALMSSGSELAQAPSAGSGLGSMASAPMSAASPMASGLGSPTAGSGNTGANNGTWYGAMPGAGGTVAAAALSGGGGAGMGGLGGAGALGAAGIRGPGSWGSTVNAAPEADRAVLSRFEVARAASTTPATSGGMGSPGAMMQPRPAASQQERRSDDGLAAAPIPYRMPTGMPVVTGAYGARSVAGEEGQ